MFKNKFFRKGKNQEEEDNQWMLDSFHAEEDLKRENSSNSSNGGDDGSSSEEEEDSDEDSVDLMTEKKIYTNEHKHHPDTEQDFRWSIKPDSRISNGANTMKVKKLASPKKTPMKMLGSMPEVPEDSNDEKPYLSSDDEDDLYFDEESQQPNEVPDEKPANMTTCSKPEEVPDGGEIVHTEEVAPAKKKKKQKQKKKSDINNSARSTKTDESSIGTSGRSVGSKKGKKKVGKKGKKNNEELKVKKKKKKKGNEELKVSKPKKKKASLKDRIRASLAMIGDRGGVLPKNGLGKLGISVIQEAEEETTTPEEESFSFLVEEQKETVTKASSKEEVEEPITEAPATQKEAKLAVLLKGGGPGSPNAAMSPLQQFREAGQKMRAMLKVRQSVVDSTFAAAFSSHEDEAVNAGLMSKSDRATVDKLLAELQQYESQLEQERNQLAEDREMMILQQESVEQLLETENETTRQLEARVLELENILENEVYQQENEELMMKVQMLEAEVERQEAALANMATEQQQVMKRQASATTVRTATSISSDSAATRDSDARDGWIAGTRSSGREEEDHDENDCGSMSAPIPNGAKLQGELLQLRSSLNHKDTALEEQAQEIARLREQLAQSEQVQRLSQLEATCEDFRNENKQLKQELAKVDAARQAELIQVARLKQSNTEKTQALKKAEEEKDEALRKLETHHHPLNMNFTKPRESTINNVLNIGAPAQYGTTRKTARVDFAGGITNVPTETNTDTITEEAKEIEESDKSDPNQVVQVPEKKNWFGFGGGNGGSDSNEHGVVKEEESSGWFGFSVKDDDEEAVKEEEGSGWFGFGQKEKEDASQVKGKGKLDALLDF